MDRCWERRRHFCLFLSYLGFLSSEGVSRSIIAFSSKYGNCKGVYVAEDDGSSVSSSSGAIDSCLFSEVCGDGVLFGQLISKVFHLNSLCRQIASYL